MENEESQENKGSERLDDLGGAEWNTKTGKAKAIKVSTLIKLCDALDCQPGDLLEFRRREEKE